MKRLDQRVEDRQMLAPCDCESLADILSLRCSFNRVSNWTFLIQHDGAVIITEQRQGEKAVATIIIPRRHFATFLGWYETKQEK